MKDPVFLDCYDILNICGQGTQNIKNILLAPEFCCHLSCIKLLFPGACRGAFFFLNVSTVPAIRTVHKLENDNPFSKLGN